MPIYEYECRSCHSEFEHFVRPSSSEPAADPQCPHCQSPDLERKRSAFAVNSEGTRHTNLQKARRQNMPIARDKQHAEAEVMARIEREHDHDHGH